MWEAPPAATGAAGGGSRQPGTGREVTDGLSIACGHRRVLHDQPKPSPGGQGDVERPDLGAVLAVNVSVFVAEFLCITIFAQW